MNTIETALQRIPGVESASVALATKRGKVVLDPNVIGPRDVIDAIEACSN